MILRHRARRADTRTARIAYAGVLVSALAASCGRDKDETSPAPEDTRPLPYFRVPKRDAPRPSASASASAPAVDAGRGAGGSGGARPVPQPAAAPEFSWGGGGGCPEGMARIASFCIDRYEAHLLGRDGSVHPHNKSVRTGDGELVAVSAPGVMPQGHLSQETAAAACSNAGKRLCTLAEWQAACGGRERRAFPYGNVMAEGTCNTGKKPHILNKHFPEIPHLKRTGKQFNDPSLLLDPDYLESTGNRAGCVTPEGVHDMDGNLSEWVSDTVMKDGVLHGTFAGDSFSGSGRPGCSRKTNAHSSNYLDYSMGTRCCSGSR